MVDNKKDNDTDFDDDAFDDVDEFADTDFDEDALEDDNEFAELSPDDVDDDFADEEMDDGEWQDDKALNSKSKKQKAPKESGGGLSFNTMVMIGAFVIGAGVLVFNVMTQSAEQNAGKKGVFQSIMSMAGVMDGTLSGNDDDAAPASASATAQSEDRPDAAFLNNPDSVVPNPPAPTPIAPAETGEALTPLPTNTAGETPRGPDETPPGTAPTPTMPDIDVAGSTPSPGMPSDVPVPSDNASAAKASAEDILKQAMANHDQKKAPAADDSIASDGSTPDPAKLAAANLDAAAKAPVDATVTPPSDAAVAIPSTTTSEPTPSTNPSVVSPVDVAEVAANKRAVVDLQGKIDTLLKRMDQIESDLGSVKESKGDYQQIESTVNSLKDEISAIKDRPAPPAPAAKVHHGKPVVQEDIQPVGEATPAPEAASTDVVSSDDPKAAPVPKKKVKKASAPAKWELRAAQPGRAWVSKPGARDMQGVEVGQSLPGIGKITAISYQNGRWTVYGTTGQINQ